MKMKIKKIPLLLFAVTLFFSCTQEDNEVNSTEFTSKEHMYFKSPKDLYTTIDQISQYDEEELDSWATNNNPGSLYSSILNNEINNIDLLKIPRAYTAILNKNSEFILNDKIIWLNNGTYYQFDFEEDREVLKMNISLLKPIGKLTITSTPILASPPPSEGDDEIDPDEGSGGSGSGGSGGTSGCNPGNTGAITGVGYPGNNQTNTLKADASENHGYEARYQAEFDGKIYKDCSNTEKCINARLKYVHELQTVYTQISTGHSVFSHAILYLNVKLEYKSTWSWKEAGEPRDIDINLDVSGITFNGGTSVSYTINKSSVNESYTCKTGIIQIPLKAVDYFWVTGNPYWDITIPPTSYIDHRIHGNYYRWLNYFHYY